MEAKAARVAAIMEAGTIGPAAKARADTAVVLLVEMEPQRPLSGEIGLARSRRFPSGLAAFLSRWFPLFRLQHGEIGAVTLLPSCRLSQQPPGEIGVLPSSLPSPRQLGETGHRRLSLLCQKRAPGPTGLVLQRRPLLPLPAAPGLTGRQVHLPRLSRLHQSLLPHLHGLPRPFNRRHKLLLPRASSPGLLHPSLLGEPGLPGPLLLSLLPRSYKSKSANISSRYLFLFGWSPSATRG